MNYNVVIFVVILIVFITFFIMINNGVVRKSKEIEAKELAINTEKNKKSNLFVSLINSIEDYNRHEEGIINKVTEARSLLRDGDLSSTRGVINALAESYPDLKAQGNYEILMNEISLVENQITKSIRDYNNSVKDYEAFCELFPNNLLIVRKKKTYKTIEEEVNEDLQTVNFSRKDV